MSGATDVNMTGMETPPQDSTAMPNTESSPKTPQRTPAQQTPDSSTPSSALIIRVKARERPRPKSKEPHSETPFGLKRIGLPNGGFYVPSQIYHTKDFIDNTYCHPSGPVTTLLHAELTHFLSLSIYPHDKPTLPNPRGHCIAPHSITFPLWRQTPTCGSHLPTWPAIKSFLRQFRPCIDAAGEAFKKFRPGDHAHMLLYHDHLMRAFPTATNPGLGLPVWGDKYRTPFARMRVSVDVERGL
ncbi:hypothetical protein IFR04_011101, partial [Cadophora malorum]